MNSTIQQIHKKLITKELSCVSIIQDRLDALSENNKNSVNVLLKDQAIAMAKKVDAKIAKGKSIGLLEGIPFGLKDTYMLQGTYTSASSSFLKKYRAPYTATAIDKLLHAGAIPIVKENGDSFGHGSTSENTIFGSVKNARNDKLVAGGSSGGSAVNVACGYTVFSIGGDTGGSIRQPAGYNGIYGLKPTYGRISRYGLMAYASSTDCVGPLANSLEDIALLLNVMSGLDKKDLITRVSQEIEIDKLNCSIAHVKVGYFTSFIDQPHLDTSIKRDFKRLLEKLKEKGVQLIPLDFFDVDTLVSTYYILAMAETASNLSRLDGMNYGRRLSSSNLKETYALTRSENFSQETKRRIVGGNQVLSQGFSDDIYMKAMGIRNTIINRFKTDFNQVDIILSPVTPSPIPELGSALKNPHTMYLSDAYTVGFSLAQLPTLTCPLGTDTGIQITASHMQEEHILQFAHFLNKSI